MSGRVKKIAIIEMYHHHEVVLHWVRLFAGSEVELALFLSREVALSLGPVPEKIPVSLREKSDAVAGYLEACRDQLSRRDLIIITTLAGDFATWARWIPPAPVAWIVHNRHAFFAPERYLLRGECLSRPGKMLGRLLKNILLKREIRWRKRWVRSHPAALFPAHSWDTPVGVKGQCINLPLAIHKPLTENPERKQEGPVIIVIPGVVRSQGRNYRLVQDVFEKLLPRMDRPVRLVLLGSTLAQDGQRLAAGLKHLRSSKLEVQTFENPLDQNTYENFLQQADFLLLPLQEESCYSVYREALGISKISGGVNDMIRFGKPAILPAFYSLPDELEHLTGRYREASDLSALLVDWINHRSYLPLAEQAGTLLVAYGVAEMRKKTLEILESFVP